MRVQDKTTFRTVIETLHLDIKHLPIHSYSMLRAHLGILFAIRMINRQALYSIGPCFYHQSHPQLGIVFALAPSLHFFWSYTLSQK